MATFSPSRSSTFLCQVNKYQYSFPSLQKDSNKYQYVVIFCFTVKNIVFLTICITKTEKLFTRRNRRMSQIEARRKMSY